MGISWKNKNITWGRQKSNHVGNFSPKYSWINFITENQVLCSWENIFRNIYRIIYFKTSHICVRVQAKEFWGCCLNTPFVAVSSGPRHYSLQVLLPESVCPAVWDRVLEASLLFSTRLPAWAGPKHSSTVHPHLQKALHFTWMLPLKWGCSALCVCSEVLWWTKNWL